MNFISYSFFTNHCQISVHKTSKNTVKLGHFCIILLDPEDGLDFHTFRNGVKDIFALSEKLARKIFDSIDVDFSGWLGWEEFIEAM